MSRTQKQVNALVETVLSAAPHKTHGLSAISVGPGEAVLEFVAGPASFGPTGAIHGGVLAMLMEPAAVCALLALLADDMHAVTADMHVQHMRPAPAGARLRITGRVLRLGKTLAFCEASVTAGDVLYSTARLTKAVVKAG
ncbi:MAG: PaaI family thioesterase [Rhodoblastus sp.]